jgi:methylaspartate mutase epsilon subunit
VTGFGTRSARTLVVAGVGGDAHSVGLITLARNLSQAGYQVRYLATQNTVTELCAGAARADAVLVSNMDGHARYYLTDLRICKEAGGLAGIPWYLGGNPSLIGEGEVEELKRLGFDRVFEGYVDPLDVVATLDADLGITGAECPPGAITRPDRLARCTSAMRVVNTNPLAEREYVLSQWHSGEGARDLAVNAAALANATWLSTVQDAAGRMLLHPRTGVAEPAGQLELFRVLREGGADVLSIQVDSLTRNNAYAEAEQALKEQSVMPGGPSMLNGYPAVNHGVTPLRAMTEEFAGTALQIRHSTRDPRLLAEIAFAGGVAAFEGGPVSYNIPYFRDYPPHEALSAWRYVDALAGRYHEQFGIVIDREFFGVLTASLIPPCLALAVDILEALLAADEGVRSVSLGYAEQGNRVQDVAAIRALRRLAIQYLAERGHQDIAVHTVFHQYMGAFPISAEKSQAVVTGSAVTAALSGATRLMLKTPVEAVRIPVAEDNIKALELVRQSVAGAASEELPATEVMAEEELIIGETRAILDAVLAAGRGDVGTGVARAIECGILDIPFAPSVWNAGRVISVRDSSGAVRFADPGAIPLPAAIREHHRSLVTARLAGTGLGIEDLVNEDVLRVGRGHFDTWPLG